jgi:hypothetical protein
MLNTSVRAATMRVNHLKIPKSWIIRYTNCSCDNIKKERRAKGRYRENDEETLRKK